MKSNYNTFFLLDKRLTRIIFILTIILSLGILSIIKSNLTIIQPTNKIINDKPINIQNSAYAQTETLIVICVEFSNRLASSSTSSIMNKISSLEDYYDEVSYGLKDISGALANTTTNDLDFDGWYDIGIYNLYQNFTINWKSFLQNVYTAADTDVNFNNFDHIMIVCAGNDYAQSHNSNDIHSHFISFTPGIVRDRTIHNSCIVAELDPFAVYTHEFGHSQGLPDLYDIDTGDGIDQIFVGDFSIMAEGSWNGNPSGSTPAGLIGFNRLNLSILDVSATVINGTHQVVDLLSLSETNISALIKIPLQGDCYYLLEYRKKLGTDAALPDQGVLITYVNESKGCTWIGGGHVMTHENGPVILEDAQSSTSSLDDAPFDIGINEISYFNDNTNNVHIVLLEKNSSGYKIDIDRTGMGTDNTPPTTSFQISGWYSEFTLFMGSMSLSAYDFKSGINKTFYRINNGTWQEYSSMITTPFTFSPTTYIIEYYSIDMNGNIESVKTISITVNNIFILLILIGVILAIIILIIYAIFRSTRGNKKDKSSSYQGTESSSNSYYQPISSSPISTTPSTSVTTLYTKICINCNMEYPEDQSFCFNCGKPLSRKSY